MGIAAIVFKIVLAFLCISFIIKDIYRIIKKEAYFTLFKFITTNIIWGTILVFTLKPSLAKQISIKLGLGDNLNTLIFIGFVIVFLLVFRIIRITEQHEKTITDLVRKQALSKLTEENNPK